MRLYRVEQRGYCGKVTKFTVRQGEGRRYSNEVCLYRTSCPPGTGRATLKGDFLLLLLLLFFGLTARGISVL